MHSHIWQTRHSLAKYNNILILFNYNCYVLIKYKLLPKLSNSFILSLKWNGVCVCLCMYVRACLFEYMWICKPVLVHAHLCVCMCVCVRLLVCVSLCVSMWFVNAANWRLACGYTPTKGGPLRSDDLHCEVTTWNPGRHFVFVLK